MSARARCVRFTRLAASGHNGNREFELPPQLRKTLLLLLLVQHSALTVRITPRVKPLRIGAPPGMYESRYLGEGEGEGEG